ncbi:MAG: hypothetical protein H6849_04995 [Alphaproteobacteria bacterium]|nr:MAG: hypothetical protein H6849_04995 [Alphaproteobacteria bacterium]
MLPHALHHVLSYLQEYGFFCTPLSALLASLPPHSSMEDYNVFTKHKDDFIHDLFMLTTESSLRDTSTQQTSRAICFEVLMRRFDRLKPYRSLLQEVSSGKQGLVNPFVFFNQARSCETKVLSFAYRQPPQQMLFSAIVFLGFFSSCFRVWLDDSSTDDSQTMAALDRSLERYESICHYSS